MRRPGRGRNVGDACGNGGRAPLGRCRRFLPRRLHPLRIGVRKGRLRLRADLLLSDDRSDRLPSRAGFPRRGAARQLLRAGTRQVRCSGAGTARRSSESKPETVAPPAEGGRRRIASEPAGRPVGPRHRRQRRRAKRQGGTRHPPARARPAPASRPPSWTLSDWQASGCRSSPSRSAPCRWWQPSSSERSIHRPTLEPLPNSRAPRVGRAGLPLTSGAVFGRISAAVASNVARSAAVVAHAREAASGGAHRALERPPRVPDPVGAAAGRHIGASAAPGSTIDRLGEQAVADETADVLARIADERADFLLLEKHQNAPRADGSPPWRPPNTGFSAFGARPVRAAVCPPGRAAGAFSGGNRQASVPGLPGATRLSTREGGHRSFWSGRPNAHNI